MLFNCCFLFLSPSRNDALKDPLSGACAYRASTTDQRPGGGPWPGQFIVCVIVVVIPVVVGFRVTSVEAKLCENHLAASGPGHPDSWNHDRARMWSDGLANTVRPVGPWQRSDSRCKYTILNTANCHEKKKVNQHFSSVRFLSLLQQWEDVSMNVISETSPTTMARVVSRLVLDHSTHTAESTYTCIGRSGGQIAVASTTVYHVDGPRSNFTDILKTGHHMFMHLKQARVTLHYKALFEYMGSTVILPCKTVGRPLPEVTWKNEEGNVISSMQDPRFRTLATGELVINNLRWADMGSYTCVAKNAISKDEAETFLYPIRPN